MTLATATIKKHSPRWVPVAIGVALLVALLIIGFAPRMSRRQEAKDVVANSPVLRPQVIVVRPKKAPAVASITLPGDLQPLYSTSVYARTNGYIEKRFVDIGSHVKVGQLLAIIATPEIDQQLNQARADLEEARAAVEQSKAALEQSQSNLEIARITRDRYAPLITRRAVTQQSLDEATEAYHARKADVAASRANIDAAQATLNSKKANVQRLTQLQDFERVGAPFDGVITARNIEQGDLVNDGSNNGSKSLFSIAQSKTLRVQVEVPQSIALSVKNGQRVTVTVQERPDREYVATVTRNAESVDLVARTMLTEVHVDNSDGSLVPGMYGEIRFDVASDHPSVIIPATALVIDKAGMHVVVVSSDKVVHIAPVEIGRDMGSEVEISRGLQGGETLVSNPSDLLSEDQQVEIAK